MSIPDYQTLMAPLLALSSDGRERRFRDAVDELAERLGISEEDQTELLPSGRQAVFRNRVGWARTYLVQAGALESTRRGFFQITERGMKLIQEHPHRVDNSILESFEEFQEFKRRKTAGVALSEEEAHVEIAESETPEDAMARAYKKLRREMESEILSIVSSVSPAFFEQLVVDVLVQMGYGGNAQDAARAVGRSGDGGIDGIINEDHLGLDVIFIQAKRWEASVGRPEVQKFAGALQGQRARKGIMITTSDFTREAQEYAGNIDSKIVLINGAKLASLMLDHNVGVSIVGQYQIKRIDSDYFDEDV